jgi:DnaK suppressor protein
MPRATKTTPPKPTKAAKVAKVAKVAKAAKPTKPTRATKAAAPAKPAGAAATARRAASRASKSTTKTTTKSTKTKTPTKQAAPGGAPLDKFLDAQRSALLSERETYTRQARDLLAEAEQLAADREPGDVQFDEESGQGDSMNVERERDLVLSAQAMAAVEDIDLALARIDARTYGVCEKCGEPIPRERLRALPYAALCVKCKSGGLSRR